jgi:hypothetical protein
LPATTIIEHTALAFVAKVARCAALATVDHVAAAVVSVLTAAELSAGESGAGFGRFRLGCESRGACLLTGEP